jgi:K+-transporting ATPase ATPase A chain
MFNWIHFSQLAIYLLLVVVLVKPLGWYMTRIYQGKINFFLEKSFYKLCGIQADQEMNWKQYLYSMFIFNILGLFAVYLIQRLQVYLPLNPQHVSSIEPYLAWNTAVSFVTNTDWQAYSGDGSLSYFTRMISLTTQNFLSAATGMALLIALIRGITQHESTQLGNFWVDLTRGTLYILLPLATLLACILVSQGVIQNLKPNQTVSLLQPSDNRLNQVIPMGLVASQTAISQLGTNGGGYFNVNAAHPFANPTPITNFLEMLAILILPAGFCILFGHMVNDTRQGWALLTAMILIFSVFTLMTLYFEQQGHPAFKAMGIDQALKLDASSGGNMEGKETRIGIIGSAVWSIATTATSNGSANSMLDSYSPMGGMMPLWMMHLGEVIFGGAGTGLTGMLMLVIVTVFIAGLMVGRTPEYMGKKIQPFEMKMASISVLIMPLSVLIATAVAVVTQSGTNSIGNSGPHGFTEILYAFTSCSNNNGSAFAGLKANTFFYNFLGGMLMLIGRYWIAIPALAIAGSLVQKKIIPTSSGTLSTHTPLFIVLLMSVIFILGALSFLPSLALGPIVEQLQLLEVYAH